MSTAIAPQQPAQPPFAATGGEVFYVIDVFGSGAPNCMPDDMVRASGKPVAYLPGNCRATAA